MLQILEKEVRKNPSVKDLLDSILTDVESHVAGADQSDDLTVMVMTFNNNDVVISSEAEGKDGESASYRKIELINEIQQISPMTAWVESICNDFGVTPSLAMSVTLALEEAVSNVIMYAYPDNGVPSTFMMDFDVDGNNIATWRIIDAGIPFDPTAKEDADVSLGIMERPIGGLGIFLVKQIMDEVFYSREDGKNILTMKINLKK